MNLNTLYFCSMFLAGIPAAAVAFICIHYVVRRAAWKRAKRLGRKKLGFCPSAAALGMTFLFMQIFHRPSMAHVIEVKQDVDAVEEDDEGDPKTLFSQLHRQLKRIRRGEPFDRLVFRI
jgi:beta-lactamase regulating signal transducer with metallopeptidase domain